MVLSFVGGHVFGSIAAPIAMAESWWPERRQEPWLGRFGYGVVAALWIAGSAFILGDQLSSTSFRISPAELVGTAAVVVALVAFALTRDPRPRRGSGPAPAPLVVAVVTAVLLAVRSLVAADCRCRRSRPARPSSCGWC